MSVRDNDLLPLLPTCSDPVKWITTPQVAERLRGRGVAIKYVKTVQRWLGTLEAEGVVICRRAGNTLEWQRKEGAGGLMNFDAALALQVLKRFSDRRIPAMVSHSLDSLFRVAEDRLLRLAGKEGAGVRRAVHRTPDGTGLHPPRRSTRYTGTPGDKTQGKETKAA